MTKPEPLKVGDRVKVKPHARLPPKTLGKRATVLEVHDNLGVHIQVDDYRLRFDGEGWFVIRSELRKLPVRKKVA